MRKKEKKSMIIKILKIILKIIKWKIKILIMKKKKKI